MIIKNIKAVIFDCDGVMFETREVNTQYYNCFLKHYNLPEMNEEQITFVHMHTVSESLYYLFNDKVPMNEVFELKTKIDSENKYDFIHNIPIEPYLKPILKKLKPQFKTAIATNRTDSMPYVLKIHKLENLFNFVVTADKVQNPKPAPDCLFKIAEEFKIKTQEAFFIGDSKLDEMASKSANMPFISYNNKNLNGLFNIKSLKDLEKILGI